MKRLLVAMVAMGMMARCRPCECTSCPPMVVTSGTFSTAVLDINRGMAVSKYAHVKKVDGKTHSFYTTAHGDVREWYYASAKSQYCAVPTVQMWESIEIGKDLLCDWQ